MIVPDPSVKGGIASVVNGYRDKDSLLERKYRIKYVESYRDGSKWQKLGKALCGYGAFFTQLCADRPDIVHVHSSFGPSFYRKIPFIYMSALFRVPVINHVHGAEFESFYENASAGKKKLVARVYGKCAKLIVLSEEWKRRFASFIPEKRIAVLENYCRLPKEPYDTGRKAEQVLFMGELGKRKGCYDIPAIWEQVLRQEPAARLVMAGDGEMEAVRAAFLEKGISSGVHFPGWVRNESKEKLFRESSIFLFPTYHEGMPMAVLEAMGYGLGIVTTDAGGIPKLIRNEEDGFIGKPGDVQFMARHVIRLLQEPALCMAYGRRARELALRDYSAERHMERLCAIYEAVAGKH